MREAPRTKIPESIVPAVAIIVLLIGLLLGPIAMLVGAAMGLAICLYLFRERLRGRGSLTATVCFAAAALASAAAIAISVG